MSMTTLSQKFVLGFGLAACLALGAPAAFAQETAPAEPAAAPDTAVADDLSMGVEPGTPGTGLKTVDTAVVGETYLAANFDAWEQRCIKTADGSDPCQLYQLLKDQTGNAVAEFSLFGLPDGSKAAAGATVVVPLETLLTQNIVIAVDGGETKVYPFTFCAQIGCIARVGFTQAEVDSLMKGAKGVITIVPAAAPTEKVALDVSLAGFTAGFAAVKATTPKN